MVEIFVGCLYYDCKETAYKLNDEQMALWEGKHRVINMLVLGHWLSDYRWRLRNQQVQGGGEIYEG